MDNAPLSICPHRPRSIERRNSLDCCEKDKEKILERKVIESKSKTAVANRIFWIARLALYVDGGISVLPPHHAVESTRVVPDHENPSFASVVDPKYQSRETIRSITRDPAAWTS